jgi:hypothetical protein
MTLPRVGRTSRIRDKDEQSPDFEAGRVQPLPVRTQRKGSDESWREKESGMCSLLSFIPA